MLATRARHAGRRPRMSLATPVLLLTTGASALVGLAVLPGPGMSPEVSPARSSAQAAPQRPGAGTTLARELEQRRATSAAARARAASQPPGRASRSRPAAGATAAPSPTATSTPEPPAPTFVRPGDGHQTSAYGPRWGRQHAGVDLAAGSGSPVRAVTAGRVQSAGVERGYGNCVRLLHPDGTVSVYAHLSALSVTQGQVVQAGDLLGEEGNTGNSTGPHLHFEIRSDGTPIDPAEWLRARGVTV